MQCGERGRYALNIVGCFTDNLDISNHGILYQFAVQELNFIKVFRVAFDPFDGA